MNWVTENNFQKNNKNNKMSNHMSMRPFPRIGHHYDYLELLCRCSIGCLETKVSGLIFGRRHAMQ